MRVFRNLMVLVALAVFVAACGGEESATPAGGGSEASAAPGGCDFTTPAEPAAGTQYAAAPKMQIDPDASYTATLDTSCGTMTIDLLPSSAPETVNNFVFLAEEGWYDGIRFHRVVPGFVIQAGDPLCSDRNDPACGSGGPGYEFADELTGKERYRLGTVAMANAGPNTNGSQFFIVTGSDVSLPPSYTVFGSVADAQSLEVAQTIEQLPAPGESPTDDIWIYGVTIEER